MWDNIKSFQDDLMYALDSKLDSGYILRTDMVQKSNNITKTGICLQRGFAPCGTVPTLYLEDLYEIYKDSNVNLDNLAGELYETLINSPETDTVAEIVNTDFIKENVQLKVINTEMNKAYLMDKPCMPVKGFDDLSAIAVVKLNAQEIKGIFGKDGFGTIAITDSMLRSMNMTQSELFEIATKNSEINNPASIKSMRDTLIEMMFPNGFDENDPFHEMFLPPDMDNDMIVVTSKDMMFGASTIMYDGIMDQIYEKVEGDFVIIPSSIHEIIVVRDNAGLVDQNDMLGIISTVNEGVVADSDVLSNNMYRYSGAEHTVTTIRASDIGRDLGAEI